MQITMGSAGVLVAFALVTIAAGAVPWDDVKQTKIEGLQSAAARAVQQQRVGHLPAIPLNDATWSGVGNVKVERDKAWDADGDGQCYRITASDIPQNHDHVNIADRIAIRFDKPVDLLARSSGFAFWIKTPEGLSKDLRIGVHFKVQGTDQDPVIISDTPVVQRFGDNPHLVYFDWGYVFDHSVGVFKVPPREFFTKVIGFDITIVQKRIPYTDVKLQPTSGRFFVDGLQLVDWFDGTYDNARFPSVEKINANYPLVCQGRTQQVTLIAAQFGGEEGVKSAIRAMDMMARIQSWDGSWPEMRTRLQGEFTHGMILADLARALAVLREQKRPELKEVVEIRHWKMPREKLYEQMLYRCAMSRTPGPFTKYRDTYQSGAALASGCNRPMTYVLGQHIAAQVLSDPKQKQQIMAEYDGNMKDLVAAQGSTAGGWPIFGEGNRYRGEGLHWDCGYTTDHVAIMANGSRATGDARWGQMMRKFDTVVAAMMLSDGLHIDGGLSERGNAKQGSLKAPDIVYQEAMTRHAPMLAQWAANVSDHCWANWPRGGTLWPNTRSFRGYQLGAFLTWQVYDLQSEPQPTDVGIVFPRQWPVWTAQWLDKQGEVVRQSKIIAKPDGKLVNTFKWEVGQYPEIRAVPVMVSVPGDVPVAIHPMVYDGDVSKLPANAKLTIATSVRPDEVGPKAEMVNDAATMDLPRELFVHINSGPHLHVVFLATPRGDGAKLTVRLLRKPESYKHAYEQE